MNMGEGVLGLRLRGLYMNCIKNRLCHLTVVHVFVFFGGRLIGILVKVRGLRRKRHGTLNPDRKP